MARINDYVNNANYGGMDFDSLGRSNNSFLAGLSINTDGGGSGSSFNLGDWAQIKSGSYGKLLKAYYAQEKASKKSVVSDPISRSTAIQGSANALSRSVDAFKSSSLWEKKKTTTKNEGTSETVEKEDYDWDTISKKVKAFVDSYNETIDAAAESNSKDVLKNTVDMTKMMSRNAKLLSEVGITIGSNNKLSFDADELKKEANIGSLKTLFKGHNSVASNVAGKVVQITNAAARSGGIYTGSGTYSKAVSSLASSKIDKDV